MLLSDSLSIPVDILNNKCETIARLDAKLLHLYGDWARLSLASDAPQSLVHWGTRLRFWISDGPAGYEIDGVVVARKEAAEEAAEFIAGSTEEAKEQAAEAAMEEAAGDSNEIAAAPPEREIVLRLLQCRPFDERRSSPRRWQRFSVRYHPLREQALPLQDRVVLASDHTGNCWERSWAVDINAGGIRLRTYDILVPRQRLALQFWLPDAAENRAATYSRRFALCGRVLRSQRMLSRAEDAFESMIRFEQISVEDGLALSQFLSV